MSSMKTLTLLACAAPAAGVSVDRSGFLARASLQPAVVAKTLVRVEDEWAAQAVAFYDCNTTAVEGEDCNAPTKAFQSSCATVVSAVVEGSSGDRAVVGEYMGDVCGQKTLQGLRQARCHSLAEMVAGAMSADTFENREHLDGAKACTVLWQRILAEETARVQKDRAQAAVEEDSRRKAEAAAEAEEAEEATRVAEEEKKAEEAKEKADKVAKAEEAKEKAVATEAKQKQQEEGAATSAPASQTAPAEEKPAAEPAVASAKATATEEAAAPTQALASATPAVTNQIAPATTESVAAPTVAATDAKAEATPEASAQTQVVDKANATAAVASNTTDATPAK